MSKQLRFVQFVGLVAVLATLATAFAQAGDADAAVQKTFDKLLGAIKTGDRDAFVGNATDAVKKGMTQEVMDALKEKFGPRLDKGYKASYLCQLKQTGHQIYLWKMTFKDDGDDLVCRVVMKDGKVAGFFFQ